jgi:putative ABC transport system permease protein
MERSWIIRFLRWFCPTHLLEEIEGDLLQRFERDANKYGDKKARTKLIKNTLRFFRPEIILRNKFSKPILHYMFRNNIKIAFRNFARQSPTPYLILLVYRWGWQQACSFFNT